MHHSHESVILLFKLHCNLSHYMCLCHSNMKVPSVLHSKNRAEKALFVFFFPLQQTGQSRKVADCCASVCACMLSQKLCSPLKHCL